MSYVVNFISEGSMKKSRELDISMRKKLNEFR